MSVRNSCHEGLGICLRFYDSGNCKVEERFFKIIRVAETDVNLVESEIIPVLKN